MTLETNREHDSLFHMESETTLEQLAAQAGLALVRDERGLAITDGTMSVRGDFSRMVGRIARGSLHQELLVRAAKVKGLDAPYAIDATAGLGEDALLLAAAGFSVRLFERNPVIAALLADALERARSIPELAEAVARMELVQDDSEKALRDLDMRPDVVLLDPMFPDKRKNAAVKKKLQLLQKLEQPCADETTLLEAALSAHPRKVVVKRPAKGPFLASRKPDYSLSGKAVRYDVIAAPSFKR